jgi:hypothetical protein
MKTEQDVIAEIQRRATAGQPLNSGANRGDWLYSRAVYYFGSWGKAVEAAGFSYSAIKIRPLTREEILAELTELGKTGEPVLAMSHRKLHSPALRHFGTWRSALVAAGVDPDLGRKWTRTSVLRALRDEVEAGRPMGANAIRRRDGNLYMAARRCFGTWAAAREAVTEEREDVEKG